MTVNLQWPDCVVCPVSMGAMGWCAIEYRQYVSIVAHLLGCFFFLWPTLSECPEKPELTASGFPYYTDLNCIDGVCTCLQGSWRQNYGLDADPAVNGSVRPIIFPR